MRTKNIANLQSISSAGSSEVYVCVCLRRTIIRCGQNWCKIYDFINIGKKKKLLPLSNKSMNKINSLLAQFHERKT